MTELVGLVLSCEHASKRVPSGLALGVAEADLDTHAAWDEGASECAKVMRRELRAPLWLGQYTRLAADLNRSEHNPACVPEVAWGVEVPANRGLDAAARAERLNRYWRTYRASVQANIAGHIARGRICLHVSIHSFTPDLDPATRGFDLGVLYDPGHALETLVADCMLVTMRGTGLTAEPNRPYAGTEDGFTTWLRQVFPADRYAGIEIELNQGTVRRAGGPAALAAASVAATRAALSMLAVKTSAR